MKNLFLLGALLIPTIVYSANDLERWNSDVFLSCLSGSELEPVLGLGLGLFLSCLSGSEQYFSVNSMI